MNLLKIQVKVSAINSEQYERTNVDVGLTALSNITQNLLGSSITTHCAKPSSLTPASTTTINTQEVKSNYFL